jgi:hypothetical protein
VTEDGLALERRLLYTSTRFSTSMSRTTTSIVYPLSHNTMAYLFKTGPRVPCEIDECDADFARLADMQRHVKEYHGSPLFCPEAGCGWRGAKRKGRLKRHLLQAHADIPNDFGINSPEPFPFLLAHVAQPQSPVAGQYIILSQRATHF